MRPLRKPLTYTEEDIDPDDFLMTDREETFNMTVTERRKDVVAESRTIKRSMVNRSCMNSLNFCYKSLGAVPSELRDGSTKLGHIQKVDLSFNNISDIHQLPFARLTSLKELLLNDNLISELPFSEINRCKGLRLINLSNNQLYILPALNRPTFIEARNNPFRLVTAELLKMPQLEFATFDWLDYLVEVEQDPSQERYKAYAEQYGKFKSQILEKVDYEKEENSNYCDFHCYFSVRLETASQESVRMTILSNLLIKSIFKND
jgi:Leucine-rich repeat (LRR) protein